MRKLFFIFVVVALMSFPVLAQPTPTPSADQIAAECEKPLAADRPQPTGADAPTISIVQPVTESVIYGSAVSIRIETQNFDVTGEGRHWHLWVNGQLQGMVYQPDAIIDLKPGTYLICASLGNTDHADLGEPSGVMITVSEAAAGTPIPTLAVARDRAVVQAEPGLGAAQIALVVGLGLIAAFGGWWLGARLPKGKK